MRKGSIVPEGRFPDEGYCDVDKLYGSRIEVRCPGCGRKFRASITRNRGPSGYHEVVGECACGRVAVEGIVDLQAVRLDREGAA